MSFHSPTKSPVDETAEIELAIPASLLDLLASPNDAEALDLESPAAKAYLDRLVSLGLDDLVQEPSLISNERSAVDLELVNLCYREYSTFTSVHQCSAAIGGAFDDFDSSLGKLIESIPVLEEECRQFGKGTSQIQNARKKAVLLQEHEDKLLDVLEIPQLMETCVRNGYYQEALELSAHVSTLREKHHAIVIDDVADEASGILQLMTAQLLGVLREPVKLPALIKAVGYLRKLQDLDDAELGLAFLSSRLHNYRARLIEIEKDRAEPVRYLRRYIDLFREHVFDIISQYTTIFSGVLGDQLATFVNLCVDDLTQLVHKYIPRIASDSAAMASILVQLGYCSLSFARAGLDFASLLIDPFTDSIRLSYDQASTSAAASVATALAPDAQTAPAPLTSLVSAHHSQQILLDTQSPPEIARAVDPHTPPAVLAHFPPIARFLNAHLTSLNALRLLAPFPCLPALQTSQSKSIHQATMAVLDYVEQAVSIDTPAELTRSGSRSRHTRTNSSPRADLIRRNTETQLSLETLTAKRRETKRICVAFADAWVLTCNLLRQALSIILEADLPSVQSESDVLRQLEEWIKANGEKELNGDVMEEVEAKEDADEPMLVSEKGSEGKIATLANGHKTLDNDRRGMVDNETASNTEPSFEPPSAQLPLPPMTSEPVLRQNPESSSEPTHEPMTITTTRIDSEPLVEPNLDFPVQATAPVSPRTISAEVSPSTVNQPVAETSSTIEIPTKTSFVENAASVETPVRRSPAISPKTNLIELKPEQGSHEVVAAAPSPAEPVEESPVSVGTPSEEPVVPEQVVEKLPVQQTTDADVEPSAESTEPASATAAPRLAEPVATPSVSMNVPGSEPVDVEAREGSQSHATGDVTTTPSIGATESASAEDTPTLAEPIEIPSHQTAIDKPESNAAEGAPGLLEPKEETVKASPDAPDTLAADDTPTQAAVPVSVSTKEVNNVSDTAQLPTEDHDPSTSGIQPEGQDLVAESGTATPAEDEEIVDSGTVTPLGDQPSQEASTAPKANKKKKKKKGKK